MVNIPYVPETAPFTPEQRAWLNGFLAGLFANHPGQTSASASNGAPAKPGEPLTILFGSQTGTAEALARKMAKESSQRGFDPRVIDLNDFEKADLSKAGKAIIISSTWGEGDPPDNAVNFWNWLKAERAPRLENLQFAVLGLGDKNYADFCGASKKFDERLASLGAQRLVDRGECDVDYESPARAWTDRLWEKLSGLTKPSVASALNGSSVERKISYDKKNPFPARLLKNFLLNRAGSAKEVRHFEICLKGSGLVYEAGDALGVIPNNCPELVDEMLAALKCDGSEPVSLTNLNLSFREALKSHFDLMRPSSELLAAVAKSAKELAPLLATEKAANLKKWLWGRDVTDVLRLSSEAWMVEQIVPLLRRLGPRLYSISSSPKAHPDEVHLTVSSVRYESFGRGRKGVASTFLADRVSDADFIKIFVQPSHGFKCPANGDLPIIMVGPGTGVAPFRAFLEERQVVGAKGKNWLLFGDQKRASDFLYEDQLTGWLTGKHLSRLDVAFSRDQAEKIYVQDRMIENAMELWSWLEEGAHFYVCGDASRMAKDVDAALHKIIETAGGKSADDAKTYVAKLKSEKRYQRDVY